MDSRTSGVYAIGSKMLFILTFMLAWYAAKATIVMIVYPIATAMWLTGKVAGGNREDSPDSPNTVARRILGFSIDLPEPPPGESVGEKIDKWAKDAEFPRLMR